MIVDLTTEQEALIPAHRDEWLAHGTSTEPTDWAAAEEGVRVTYRDQKLPEPTRFVHAESPLAGALMSWLVSNFNDYCGAILRQLGSRTKYSAPEPGAAQTKKKLREVESGVYWTLVQLAGERANVDPDILDQVRTRLWDVMRGDAYPEQPSEQVRAAAEAYWESDRRAILNKIWDQVYRCNYGHHDAYWLAFYDFFLRYCTPEQVNFNEIDDLKGLIQVGKAAGWWWAYHNVVIISARPTILGQNNREELHGEDGPALAYPDGWSLYFWNGTQVPKDLIDPGWDYQRVLREENAEVRRCAIERVGWENFVEDANLRHVSGPVEDPANPGHVLNLFDVPEQIYDEPVRVLICDNATPERDGTRRRFGLTVPASITDPVAAAAWTFQLNPDQYRKLQRAT